MDSVNLPPPVVGIQSDASGNLKVDGQLQVGSLVVGGVLVGFELRVGRGPGEVSEPPDGWVDEESREGNGGVDCASPLDEDLSSRGATLMRWVVCSNSTLWLAVGVFHVTWAQGGAALPLSWEGGRFARVKDAGAPYRGLVLWGLVV